MKWFSLMTALSALLVIGQTAAQAQQSLTGTVMLQDTGVREIPSGANEIGRFGRFVMDHRLTDTTFKNTDFKNWKPLTPYSRNQMRYMVSGAGITQPGSHPIPDQPVGRFGRFVMDHRLTDTTFENRDFANWKPMTPYARNSIRYNISGLGVGTHQAPRRVAQRVIINVPIGQYF